MYTVPLLSSGRRQRSCAAVRRMLQWLAQRLDGSTVPAPSQHFSSTPSLKNSAAFFSSFVHTQTYTHSWICYFAFTVAVVCFLVLLRLAQSLISTATTYWRYCGKTTTILLNIEASKIFPSRLLVHANAVWIFVLADQICPSVQWFVVAVPLSSSPFLPNSLYPTVLPVINSAVFSIN